MATYTLSGAEVKLYIGGQLYKECQSVSYTINYAQEEIFGVDSEFAQEITTSRITVTGSVSGIRLKASGGLQANQATDRIIETLYAPYTSIRIEDRNTGYILFYCDQIKVTTETVNIQTKGSVRVSFNFKGIIPRSEIDVYDP
jgi:hypothetical protein